MGVYYFAANHTKREKFWPDYLGGSDSRWAIKCGCLANPVHPFALGLSYMMAYDWRGDHVVIADDTNTRWWGCEEYTDISDKVDALVRDHFPPDTIERWFNEVVGPYGPEEG